MTTKIFVSSATNTRSLQVREEGTTPGGMVCVTIPQSQPFRVAGRDEVESILTSQLSRMDPVFQRLK